MRSKLSSLLVTMLVAGLVAFAASGCSISKKLDPNYIFGSIGKRADDRGIDGEDEIEGLQRGREASPPHRKRDVSPQLLPARASVADTGPFEAFAEAVDSLAMKIEAAFPPVEGRIVALEGDDIFLSVSARDGVRRGTVLNVIREGDYFRHPLTDEILGRYEEDLGAIEVVEVRDDYSRGIALSGNRSRMKRGDMVRISRGRIGLAVFPIASEAGEGIDTLSLYEQLTASLGESDRFQLLDQDRLQIWLLERGYRPDQLMRREGFERLKRDLPSDYYLFTRLKLLRGRYILSSTLISDLGVDESKKFSAVVRGAEDTWTAQLPSPVGGTEASPEAAEKKAPLPTRGAQDLASPDKELFSYELDLGKKVEGEMIDKISCEERMEHPAVAMDVADVDGDGFMEVIVGERNGFRILKYSDMKQGFEVSPRYELGDQLEVISLDAADLNGNGLAELYVVEAKDRSVTTQVMEFDGSGFSQIARETDRFSRVIDHPREGPMLVGQSCGIYSPLVGGVDVISWSPNGLVPSTDGALLRNMKRELNIFAFAVGDLDGDGEEDILKVDDEGYLRIYGLSGNFKWRSRRKYECHSIRLNGLKPDDGAALNEDDLSGDMLRIPGRIIIRDVDRDGLNEVILAERSVSHSEELKGIASFESSSGVILGWDGVSLYEKWRTAEVPGYATALNLADVDHDGNTDLVMSLIESVGGVRKGRIVVFELME